MEEGTWNNSNHDFSNMTCRGYGVEEHFLDCTTENYAVILATLKNMKKKKFV